VNFRIMNGVATELVGEKKDDVWTHGHKMLRKNGTLTHHNMMADFAHGTLGLARFLRETAEKDCS